MVRKRGRNPTCGATCRWSNESRPRRVHEVRVAMGTIPRIFRDLGIPYLRRVRKRVPRQMKLFEKEEPGESVQVDVKFVKIAGRWAFQYTALDDCTRFRVLRLYRRLHQGASVAFLAELQRALPFRIRKLQCDNGREFPLDFVLAVEAAGSRHRYIRPRRPRRTARSNVVIGSTRKSSGGAIALPASMPPPRRFGRGNARITTNASLSPCKAEPPPRSSPAFHPPLAA